MKLLIFFISILLCLSLTGQKKSILKAKENQLIQLLYKVRHETNFKKALEINQQFEDTLRSVLRYDASFKFPFDSLSKIMSTIRSPDNTFRLFNWNIELEHEEQYYCCLIMKYDEKKEEYITLELFDKSASAIDPEFIQYNNKSWYGALYYSIIPVPKGNGFIYTLLGWDGNNKFSNKKVIETMVFQGKDKIKFGFPIFIYKDKKTKRRVIFQYNKQSYMSLKYHKIKKQKFIIFDHLSPKSPQLEGMYDWYVTDLSFDAFKLNKNKWIYMKDFEAKTLNNFKDRPYNDPK